MYMNLRTPEYVCTLADTGSYSKAAAHLYISQPTLSIFIKKLETEMGTVLFKKEDKKIVPTYIGEIFVDSCRRILKINEDFESVLKCFKSGTAGILRIGTTLRLSPSILPSILPSFLSAYPEVNLQLKEDNASVLLEEMEKGNIDLVLCNTDSNALDSLETIYLKKDRLLIVLPGDHPANSKAIFDSRGDFPKLDLKYLKDELFLLQNETQSIRQLSDQAFKASGIYPQRVIEVSNIETSVHLAANGVGISFCMENYRKAFHPDNPINFYIPEHAEQSFDFCMVYRKGLDHMDYFHPFVEIVKKHSFNFFIYGKLFQRNIHIPQLTE